MRGALKIMWASLENKGERISGKNPRGRASLSIR